VCPSTMLIFLSSMLASIRFKMFLKAKIDQGAKSFINYKDDISTTASVSTPRAAFRHVFLTAKCNHTVAPIAAFDKYLYFIDKHFLTYSHLYVMLIVVDLRSSTAIV